MKVRPPKLGLRLVAVLMVGAAVATGQVSSAAPLSTSKDVPGKAGVPSVKASETSAVESALPSTTARSLPDAPSAIAKGVPAEEPVTPPSQSREKAPVPVGSISIGTPFWVANGALLGSSIANAEMITRCRPTSCLSIPDAIRTRGALYGIAIPASIGMTYISYRLKRSGTRMWIVPVALLTAGNLVYAWHAAQWSK